VAFDVTVTVTIGDKQLKASGRKWPTSHNGFISCVRTLHNK